LKRYIRTTARDQHKQIDEEYKKLARQYRRSAALILRKIKELESLCTKVPVCKQSVLSEELTLLRSMYRSTHDIGREAEHYYEIGWWRSEVYTVNSR